MLISDANQAAINAFISTLLTDKLTDSGAEARLPACSSGCALNPNNDPADTWTATRSGKVFTTAPVSKVSCSDCIEYNARNDARTIDDHNYLFRAEVANEIRTSFRKHRHAGKSEIESLNATWTDCEEAVRGSRLAHLQNSPWNEKNVWRHFSRLVDATARGDTIWTPGSRELSVRVQTACY